MIVSVTAEHQVHNSPLILWYRNKDKFPWSMGLLYFNDSAKAWVSSSEYKTTEGGLDGQSTKSTFGRERALAFGPARAVSLNRRRCCRGECRAMHPVLS